MKRLICKKVSAEYESKGLTLIEQSDLHPTKPLPPSGGIFIGRMKIFRSTLARRQGMTYLSSAPVGVPDLAGPGQHPKTLYGGKAASYHPPPNGLC